MAHTKTMFYRSLFPTSMAPIVHSTIWHTHAVPRISIPMGYHLFHVELSVLKLLHTHSAAPARGGARVSSSRSVYFRTGAGPAPVIEMPVGQLPELLARGLPVDDQETGTVHQEEIALDDTPTASSHHEEAEEPGSHGCGHPGGMETPGGCGQDGA